MQPEAAYETTMRLAFREAIAAAAPSPLRRLVASKLHAGIGTKRSGNWRVTRR